MYVYLKTVMMKRNWRKGRKYPLLISKQILKPKEKYLRIEVEKIRIFLYLFALKISYEQYNRNKQVSEISSGKIININNNPMNQQKAILISGSTDEQAEKGYSLKHQEERLRQYCQHQQIEVVAVLQREDHSAKTFERPEFANSWPFKKNRDVLTCSCFKMDRFSRNAGDAMQW